MQCSSEISGFLVNETVKHYTNIPISDTTLSNEYVTLPPLAVVPAKYL